jgi:hypothetical protein
MPGMANRPRVVNRLPQFITSVQQRAAVAMNQALIVGAAEASVLTPIDTSTLLNSQYRRVERDGARIRGVVGYTAEYALPVHDPANPQRFRRATAEKEFLLKGMERARPNIERVLRGSIKT